MKQRRLAYTAVSQIFFAAIACAPSPAQMDDSLRVPRSGGAPASAVIDAPKHDAVKPAAKLDMSKLNASKQDAKVPAKPAVTKPAAVKAAATPAQAALAKGISFSQHGLYSEAYNFFTKAADLEPKNPEPYNRRARVEWQLEKNKEALEDASYAISLNPDYAEAFLTRAAILNSTGKYREAIADTSLAMELKPKLRESYSLQASAYRNLKQYKEADAITDKIAATPGLVSAFQEFSPNIDYAPYVGDIQQKVRSHWQPPQGAYPPIIVLFKMHRNGTVSDVRVNQNAVATADNAAIETVKTSEPFNQPPNGSPPDFDCFVVLDPPMQQAEADMNIAAQQQGQQPNNQADPTAATAQALQQKSGIKWGSALNTGLNTGLNLMRFVPMRW
ncbi:MAG TPA: TonB C-terminal domain-containing protein [Drouetiella sp.]